jgi:hypothetical protein
MSKAKAVSNVPHTNPLAHDPFHEYRTRLAERQSQADALSLRYRYIGIARIAFLVTGAIILLTASTNRDAQFALWLIPVVMVSVVLLVMHQQIFQRRNYFLRAVKFYQRGIERLTGNWAGQGIAGHEFRHEAHPYAEDIDLFGEASLFELLCTARTKAGEALLAAWLKAPAEAETIRQRQLSVAELRQRLDLRESLALVGDDVRSGLHPETISAWGERPTMLSSGWRRIVAVALTSLTILSLLAWFSGYGLIPLFSALLLTGLFKLQHASQTSQIVKSVQLPGRDLALLSQLLKKLEEGNFTSPGLRQLEAALETGGHPPSQQIAQLQRLITWLDARLNQFFMPLAFALLWEEHFAEAIERWRARSGPLIARWIAAVGELEALCALGGYAYEHPRDPFPEIVEGERCFEGKALGHPLLAASRCVRTDLRLDESLRLLVVSGSNMSGKSTLLRTVGLNAVLALAGAPVRAESLRISVLSLGASIRIQDNLRAGASLFYAEIQRLRQLMEMTGQAHPLLFVIDEILHGTNSHDRRLGAEAVLQGLFARGAMGLVTTHDLALTAVVDKLAPRAANVHFADTVENGQMVFDYILRPGVVQKSNAIELMRSVGLEV